VRPCDWHIPELRQFKALPEDAKPVHSKHWHSADEAFTSVATGLRSLLEKKGKKSAKFVPDERHATAEQREELRRIHHEIVTRLIARKAHMDDDIVKKEYGKWAGIVWSQFHEHFETTENKLPSLPKEKFEDAKQWLIQYRASKDKNLKRTKPQEYRNTHTKAIYSNSGALGWSKGELYAFAASILEYTTPIASLSDLGSSQLEKLRDKVRYESTKRRVKSSQSKAKRAPAFVHPTDPVALELLTLILDHPVAAERGLTEILKDSPSGPLDRAFISNITARGAANAIRKSLFGPAIAELTRLGWLLPPEGNHAVRIYELNPKAAPKA
jgi:hypothetical protein